MAQRGKSFTLKDPGALTNLVKGIISIQEKADKEMYSRMQTAVSLVYNIAHQKRPYISADQAKAQGRGKFRGKSKYHLVSDPDAQAGVAVAQMHGGALQAGIKKEVTQARGKTTGTITVDVDYGPYLEFGTSKMRARPFMRPAILLTREAVKKVFQTPLDFKKK